MRKSIKVSVLHPTKPVSKKLTKDDVWGSSNDNGMIVGNSHGLTTGNICPVFKDEIPYKSVTVICGKDQFDEVCYWLEYVHGGGSIGQTMDLPDNKIAIRSNYMCW